MSEEKPSKVLVNEYLEQLKLSQNYLVFFVKNLESFEPSTWLHVFNEHYLKHINSFLQTLTILDHHELIPKGMLKNCKRSLKFAIESTKDDLLSANQFIEYQILKTKKYLALHVLWEVYDEMDKMLGPLTDPEFDYQKKDFSASPSEKPEQKFVVQEVNWVEQFNDQTSIYNGPQLEPKEIFQNQITQCKEAYKLLVPEFISFAEYKEICTDISEKMSDLCNPMDVLDYIFSVNLRITKKEQQNLKLQNYADILGKFISVGATGSAIYIGYYLGTEDHWNQAAQSLAPHVHMDALNNFFLGALIAISALTILVIIDLLISPGKTIEVENIFSEEESDSAPAPFRMSDSR
jgi:hypothetical protein